MKKIIAFLCCIALVSAFTLNAFAEKADVEKIFGVTIPGSGEQYEYNPNARYVPVCGKYATHDMLSNGWCRLENSTTHEVVYPMGTCWQCTRCYLVLTTQNEPESSQGLGYYSYWQADAPTGTHLNVLVNDSSHIYYTTSNKLDGVTFRYSPY